MCPPVPWVQVWRGTGAGLGSCASETGYSRAVDSAEDKACECVLSDVTISSLASCGVIRRDGDEHEGMKRIGWDGCGWQSVFERWYTRL